MKAKSSAHYQREYRRRLREQGLVKKEVWILPENARQLAEYERMLRLRLSEHHVITEGDNIVSAIEKWTSETLYEGLSKEELVTSKQASVELIGGVDQALHLVMHDFGDLPLFMTVVGDQIIVEAVLWPATDVLDLNAFNDTVLRTHKYFPLSTISLDTLSDGNDYYHMFGALSATSIISNVVFEIETLASNVIHVTEAYASLLNVAIEAQS